LIVESLLLLCRQGVKNLNAQHFNAQHSGDLLKERVKCVFSFSDKRCKAALVDGLKTDIPAEIGSIPIDLIDQLVGVLLGLFDIIAKGYNTEYTSTITE